jgi:hypothetical protein
MGYMSLRSGLGDDVSLGFQLGTPVVTGALAASAASTAAATGTAATILGMAPALAIPVVGAALAAVAIAVELLLHSGCGQTCIITSNWANQAAALLDKNIAAYFAIPAPRSQSQQRAAMNSFMAIWNYLYQECSNPQLGTAGKNCIADRQDGACKWKATAPAYPGEPAEGSCWNWWNAYYAPIANDPNVVPDSELPTASDSTATGTAATTGLASSTWLLLAAGLGLVVWGLS